VPQHDLNRKLGPHINSPSEIISVAINTTYCSQADNRAEIGIGDSTYSYLGTRVFAVVLRLGGQYVLPAQFGVIAPNELNARVTIGRSEIIVGLCRLLAQINLSRFAEASVNSGG
jgi:hypothetical protein